jgi:hypothetical protein
VRRFRIRITLPSARRSSDILMLTVVLEARAPTTTGVASGVARATLARAP